MSAMKVTGKEVKKTNQEKTVVNDRILSDDKDVVKKLQQKMANLEEEKEKIKARKHTVDELRKKNVIISNIRKRIREIEELKAMEFEDIEFKDGKVTCNKETNRLQIFLNEKPNTEMIMILRHQGFRGDITQKVWQRLFNKKGIEATQDFLEEIKNNC